MEKLNEYLGGRILKLTDISPFQLAELEQGSRLVAANYKKKIKSFVEDV